MPIEACDQSNPIDRHTELIYVYRERMPVEACDASNPIDRRTKLIYVYRERMPMEAWDASNLIFVSKLPIDRHTEGLYAAICNVYPYAAISCYMLLYLRSIEVCVCCYVYRVSEGPMNLELRHTRTCSRRSELVLFTQQQNLFSLHNNRRRCKE